VSAGFPIYHDNEQMNPEQMNPEQMTPEEKTLLDTLTKQIAVEKDLQTLLQLLVHLNDLLEKKGRRLEDPNKT
jgi:hypothetical protein